MWRFNACLASKHWLSACLKEASADGRPALPAMPGFVPGESHGYPEFAAGCCAVVMGRATFDPALAAPSQALARPSRLRPHPAARCDPSILHSPYRDGSRS